MEACNSGSLGEWRLEEVEAVALGCAVLFFLVLFLFCFVFFAQVGPGGEEEWKLGGKGARQFWRRRWRPEAAGNVGGADSAEAPPPSSSAEESVSGPPPNAAGNRMYPG